MFLPPRLQAPPDPLEVVLPDGTRITVPPAFDPDTW
jgi:hypothetical protein